HLSNLQAVRAAPRKRAVTLRNLGGQPRVGQYEEATVEGDGLVPAVSGNTAQGHLARPIVVTANYLVSSGDPTPTAVGVDPACPHGRRRLDRQRYEELRNARRRRCVVDVEQSRV